MTAALRGLREGKQEIDVLRLLLDAGADPNRPGYLGRTPLHLAVSLNLLEAAALLLDRGVDPTLRAADLEGETPLEIAGANGFREMEELLRARTRG